MKFAKTFFILIALTLFTISASHAQLLYGTTGGGNPGDLYTVDPSTGVVTVVGALTDGGNSYAVTGLAFDSITGVLYGSTSSQSPNGGSSLVSINPLTGQVN